MPYGAWADDLLGPFIDDRKLSRNQARKSAHLLFANAHTFDEQLKFVKRFGPILRAKNPLGRRLRIVGCSPEPVAPRTEQSCSLHAFEIMRILQELGDWLARAHRGLDEYNAYYSKSDNYRSVAGLTREQGSKHLDSFLVRRGYSTSKELVRIKEVVS